PITVLMYWTPSSAPWTINCPAAASPGGESGVSTPSAMGAAADHPGAPLPAATAAATRTAITIRLPMLVPLPVRVRRGLGPHGAGGTVPTNVSWTMAR